MFDIKAHKRKPEEENPKPFYEYLSPTHSIKDVNVFEIVKCPEKLFRGAKLLVKYGDTKTLVELSVSLLLMRDIFRYAKENNIQNAEQMTGVILESHYQYWRRPYITWTVLKPQPER